MQTKRTIKKILASTLLILIILLLYLHPDFRQAIIDYTPQDPLLAAFVLLLLYAIKSITIVLPYVALVLVTGHIYPLCTALFINLIGLVILLTVPYQLGKFLGLNTMQRFTKKYPKLKKLIERQNANSLFLCYFIRVLGCLPGDLITMYFGATGTPFWKNLLGGLLGLLPGMITMTFLGNSMKDTHSTTFWISTLLTIFLSSISAILYYIYQKRKKGLK